MFARLRCGCYPTAALRHLACDRTPHSHFLFTLSSRTGTHWQHFA